jgi:hypothetical protein
MRAPVVLIGIVMVATACGSTPAASATASPSMSATGSPSAPAPAGLWPRDANLAYDSTNHVIVLFGGNGSAGPQGDTWTFNGSAWTQQHPAASPSQRLGAMVVYDPTMPAVLVFGGKGPDGAVLGDTWAWNGTTWVRLGPAHSPSPRYGGAITYDSVRHVVLLFGGSAGEAADLNDTWTWNGLDWTQASPAQSPPPRLYARMAVHEASGDVVLFGGFDRMTDTWTWNGLTWIQVQPNHTPDAPSGEATPFQQQMAYDSATKTVIMVLPTPHSALTADDTMDTWAWDGADWQRLQPAAAPPARDGFGLVYDSTRSLVVFAGGWGFGGADQAGTWAFDGASWSSIG